MSESSDDVLVWMLDESENACVHDADGDLERNFRRRKYSTIAVYIFRLRILGFYDGNLKFPIQIVYENMRTCPPSEMRTRPSSTFQVKNFTSQPVGTTTPVES